MSTDDLEPISIVDPKGALDAFITVLREHGYTSTGGCRPFYSPQEWKARGELYGRTSLFIVCHDGGDIATAIRDSAMFQRLQNALQKHGTYLEMCTCWYSAVYPL